jgi:hypothetical protein
MQNVRNDLSHDAKLERQKTFSQCYFSMQSAIVCWLGMEGRFVWLDYATDRLKSTDEWISDTSFFLQQSFLSVPHSQANLA